MQIYLTTPEGLSEHSVAAREAFLPVLKSVMQTGLVSAMLIRRHNLRQSEYTDLVLEIAPLARSCDCAVLLDDSPAMVRQLPADGVHITSGQQRFVEALNALKPDFIVGGADLNSRHEAMLRAEAGADYLSFGAPGRAPGPDQLTLAQWWSEVFEIPCVLFDPLTPLDELVPVRCEFIGLGDNLWSAAPGPARALKTFATGCGVS